MSNNEKTGKTALPRHLVANEILKFLNYPFKEEGTTTRILCAVTTEEIDWILQLSHSYQQALGISTRGSAIKLQTLSEDALASFDLGIGAKRLDSNTRTRYESAHSIISSSTYYTASSRAGSMRAPSLSGRLPETHEYARILKTQGLWPVDPFHEQNWSGRGQHVQFGPDERKIINELLEVHNLLGHTNTAIIQSVKCKRILLARKTIKCGRQLTKTQVVSEVSHLTRLQFSHIVRVIGTYIIGKEISILIYPVTEYNLETFLEAYNNSECDEEISAAMAASLIGFFPCLAQTVAYMHSHRTKHMDLKPKNILVRDVRRCNIRAKRGAFKVYLADFGISRSYNTIEASETDGPTQYTRKYAAPEVVKQEKRGFSADIFSLGCVFVEIWASLQPYHKFYNFMQDFAILQDCCKRAHRIVGHDETVSQKLEQLLKSNRLGDSSYQANIETVCDFLRAFRDDEPNKYLGFIIPMLSQDPGERPTAEDVVSGLGLRFTCCMYEHDPLEAEAEAEAKDDEKEELGRIEEL